MNHDALLSELQRLQDNRSRGLAAGMPNAGLLGALETRGAGEPYRWDGLRRGADPSHPFVLFQYTLAGWGRYEEGGVSRRLDPGRAFVTSIPGSHRYDLPQDSPGWTFFWLILSHPYVVERVTQTKQSTGAVLTIPPQSLLLASAVRLFEGTRLGDFRDEWALEGALFEFLLEYERFCHALRYAPSRRDELLSDIRRETLETLDQPPDVARLARTRGMSRSHFSHAFKAATGIPPAQYVAQVRLEEVAQRLLTTDAILETIAAETGFADANHLCKVFRRHYHLSPGAFRRQVR